MGDYKRKRVDYINQWPQSSLFDAELQYHQRCEAFVETNGVQPFMPLKMWYDVDRDYNISLSRIIECLESMPTEPHHAFSYAFICFDLYSEKFTPADKSITERIKYIIDRIDLLVQQNSDIDQLLKDLFSSIPMQSALFLYKVLFEGHSSDNPVYKRVTKGYNGVDNANRKALIDSIYQKYGYDTMLFDTSIRAGAALLRKLFIQNSITLRNDTYTIDCSIRLHLLLSGFLYSLRNSSAHGDSITVTKSSKTSPERYALNYYAFLSMYCICSLLLIDGSTAIDKNTKYKELSAVMANNISNMKKLFGAHMG